MIIAGNQNPMGIDKVKLAIIKAIKIPIPPPFGVIF
jgi:hypothetical protein